MPTVYVVFYFPVKKISSSGRYFNNEGKNKLDAPNVRLPEASVILFTGWNKVQTTQMSEINRISPNLPLVLQFKPRQFGGTETIPHVFRCSDKNASAVAESLDICDPYSIPHILRPGAAYRQAK